MIWTTCHLFFPDFRVLCPSRPSFARRGAGANTGTYQHGPVISVHTYKHTTEQYYIFGMVCFTNAHYPDSFPLAGFTKEEGKKKKKEERKKGVGDKKEKNDHKRVRKIKKLTHGQMTKRRINSEEKDQKHEQNMLCFFFSVSYESWTYIRPQCGTSQIHVETAFQLRVR